MSAITNGENYDGAEESIRQLIHLSKKAYKAFKGPEIPKDPEEILKLAEQVARQDKIRYDAQKAEQYIKSTWKKWDREARLKRRAKLKRILTLGQKK